MKLFGLRAHRDEEEEEEEEGRREEREVY